MSLFQLFCTFFYIGLFTIGGGVVALTLMEQTIVAKGIITTQQFYNMVAISESTPGPLGINMATYIGFNLYGIGGGIIATIGQVLPSLITILIIAHFLKKFNQNKFVKDSLSFLRPVTTGLILVPALQIFIYSNMNLPAELKDLLNLDAWKILFNWTNLSGYFLFLILILNFKIHPILLIILGAVFGIVFC